MDNKSALQQQLLISGELRFVLDRLVALHAGLVELLQAEYSHMAALDVKSLAEAAQAKEAFLAEIWNLEQARGEAARKLAAGLGIEIDDVTLLAIADALPAADSEALRVARDTLSALVGRAKELNARNMAFVESSLERIDEMKRNALGINNQASKENYSNSGARQPLPEQGGRLLSTEA